MICTDENTYHIVDDLAERTMEALVYLKRREDIISHLETVDDFREVLRGYIETNPPRNLSYLSIACGVAVLYHAKSQAPLYLLASIICTELQLPWNV